MSDGTARSSTSSVLVVSGPPGAGKSTVAPLVVAALGSPSACIESDWFWTTIKTGFIPPWEPTVEEQNLAVVRSVASVAAEMASGGYHVVVEGLVGPWHLPVVAEVLGAAGVGLEYVVLRPDLATCLARATARAGEPPRVADNPPLTTSGPIRTMWEQLADLGPHERYVVDSTTMTAAKAADEILAAHHAGRLHVPTA